MILDTLHRSLRDLRISVIDRCNFRCPYCMPAEQFHHAYQFLDKNEWLSFDEITRIAQVFVSLGVRKLRITGGEPLLRPNLEQLINRLSKIQGVDDLALTTNGSLLKEWAGRLRKAGLKRLTVSLDSVDEKIFKELSGDRGNLKDVLEGIKTAQELGFKNIKLNAVIKRGVNDHTIFELVQYAKVNSLILRFIEYMDVGNQNQWEHKWVVPSDEIIQMIHQQNPIEMIDGTQNGDTAQRFRFKDGSGELGFVSSVTHAFCGTCNRLRLSADGSLYTCLFSSRGIDLKTQMRNNASDEMLSDYIKEIWQKRQDRYSELRQELRKPKNRLPKVEMYHIGG